LASAYKSHDRTLAVADFCLWRSRYIQIPANLVEPQFPA
jgi:hypothetical protein